MNTYPEIEALKNYFDRFSISFSSPEQVVREDLFFINFSIDSNSWKILIDDEYNDYSSTNPLACLFLVFNSLENYAESDDFLAWSKLHRIDSSNSKWLDYYQSLSRIYKEIEKILGHQIDSHISPYDYSLRTGVVQALFGFQE